MPQSSLRPSDQTWLRVAGIVVMAASAAAVAGRVQPSPPGAAVALLAAGAGLVALASRWRILLGLCGAAALAAIAGGLMQHGAPADIPASIAVALACIGALQILLAAERRIRGATAVVAGGVGAIAFLALLQYGAWLSSIAGAPPFRDTVLAPVFCLLLLAAALFKVGHEPSDRALPFMAAALGMLVAIGAVSVQAGRQLLAANAWVAHSYQVRGEVDRFVEEVARAESSSRAYALTGDRIFKDRVPLHEADATQRLAELRAGVADNPVQSARVARMQVLAEEKFKQNEVLLETRQEAGPAGAGQYLRALVGEPGQPTSNLVMLADQMRADENHLLEKRVAAQRSVQRNTRLVQIAGSLVATGLLLWTLLLTRRAAARRRAAESQFRHAFEDAGIGMALVGLDGHWLRVNRTLVELLGYAEAELMGSTFQDITHPDDLAADLEHVRQLVQGHGRTYQMEKRYRHRDGRMVWGNLTVSLVRNATGEPDHFISQIEDITARKHLEEKLLAARDDALAAARVKAEFLATMSHEIRTPMNGVIGMTALLLDSSLPPDQREMIEVIDQSAENLLGIINDILDISKMEAGKYTLDPVDFDFGELVKATVAMLAPRAAQKKIELAHRLDPRLSRPLCGDSRRIRQVLTNLIGNALKFTDHGSVIVSVEATEVGAAGASIRVAVRDTGTGIAPEEQKKLFQPFVQVGSSAERRHGGTGLGLAICRQLIDLMGGQLGLQSETGKGSEFWFTLALPWAEAARSDQGPSSRHRFSVLVVDDSDMDRELTVRLLQEMGIEAVTASSGAEGLAKAKAPPRPPRPWDMVLVDHHMPGMGGLEFGRTLRADPATAGIPMVLMSGGPLQAAVESSLVGFDAYLAKPVRPAQLWRVINRSAPVPRKTPEAARILVVDDNAANRSVARITLTKIGCVVELAENGEEALRKLSEAHYDAVLMDCQMPVLNGYDATGRIRSGTIPGIDPKIPIVALTAYAMSGDLEKCRAAGMDDYLPKPLRAPDLHQVLNRLGIPFDEPAPAPSPPPRDESGPSAAQAPAAGQPTTLTIDTEFISELRGLAGDNGASLWADLIKEFTAQVLPAFQAMDELASGRRQRALAEAAHHFAGSCASVGFRGGRLLALEIERLAAAGDWPALPERLALLRSDCDRFLAAVADQ